MKKSRNGLIEFVRFFAIINIACFHYEWLYISYPVSFQFGYIWVEFFFVISGYYLAKNYGGKTSWDYTWKQIKKLYPMYLAAFAFCFVAKNWGASIYEWIINLWNAKWEILLLYNWGFNNNAIAYNVGGAPAFISVLILCTVVIHFFLSKHKDFFVCVFAPLVIAFSYGKLINEAGNLSQWLAYDGILPMGIYRGMADMCVGALFAILLEKWMTNRSNFLKFLIFIICCMFVIALGVFSGISHSDLVIYVFVFAFLVCTLDTMSTNKIINSLGLFLGKISIPIFMFHSGIIELASKHVPNMEYKYGMLITVSVICVFSSAIYVFELLCKEIKKLVN